MASEVFNAARIDYGGAHCTGLDVDLFIEYENFVAARRVCRGCPVAADCFFEATRDGLTGVWGGLWHGKPSHPGAKVRGSDDAKLLKHYRAVLCERMGLTLEQFTKRYGPSAYGIKKALKAAQRR